MVSDRLPELKIMLREFISPKGGLYSDSQYLNFHWSSYLQDNMDSPLHT